MASYCWNASKLRDLATSLAMLSKHKTMSLHKEKCAYYQIKYFGIFDINMKEVVEFGAVLYLLVSNSKLSHQKESSHSTQLTRQPKTTCDFSFGDHVT